MEDTSTKTNNNHLKGFGSMSVQRRKEIASLGGRVAQRSGFAHRWTRETAALAGAIGGRRSKRGPTKKQAS